MDRLTSMEAFVEAVDGGSFAGAAPRMGISPQMVAKHVSLLEGRLGVRLLNRTTRRQSLTEFGSTYYGKCCAIIAEVKVAEALASPLRANPRGLVRVTAPPLFGGQKVIPFIRSFNLKYPLINVELVLTNRMVNLVKDKVDVAFRIGEPQDSGLRMLKLNPFPLVACASPAYLERRGTPLTPADLKGHTCFGNRAWQQTIGSTWRFTRNGKAFEVRLVLDQKLPKSVGQREIALAGKGIILVATLVTQRDLDLGSLVKVLTKYAHPSRPMHLLFQEEVSTNPNVRLLVDAAVKEFANNVAGH